ncbi:MAG TPA: hypothetical protein VGN14_13525 [Candidatus Elarobacter sp.]|jgi:hypothetical protein
MDPVVRVYLDVGFAINIAGIALIAIIVARRGGPLAGRQRVWAMGAVMGAAAFCAIALYSVHRGDAVSLPFIAVVILIVSCAYAGGVFRRLRR